MYKVRLKYCFLNKARRQCSFAALLSSQAYHDKYVNIGTYYLHLYNSRV